MLGITAISCQIYAVSSSRVVVTLEQNLLRLRSKINVKKVQKQEIKM